MKFLKDFFRMISIEDILDNAGFILGIVLSIIVVYMFTAMCFQAPLTPPRYICLEKGKPTQILVESVMMPVDTCTRYLEIQ